jgi:DNA-binding PadR family transcriptional regulator
MRLGKNQLCLLATVASPFNLVIVSDPVVRGLSEKGLIAPHTLKQNGDGSFYGITPAGLRELADQFEAGNLEQFIDPRFERDRARIYISARSSHNSAEGKRDD